MKTIAMTAAFCTFLSGLLVAEESLKPGMTAEIPFPGIGPTLHTLANGEEQVATLRYRLPDNFSREKQYPVFVFLAGGTGGGKNGGLSRAVAITGGNDYIAATLPLFRTGAELEKEEIFGGLLIGVDDLPVMAKAYRTMLTRFFETVPHARKRGNFLGGFSNGAHTTAFLVSGQEETVLKHFQHFVLVDGGIWMSGLHRYRMKKCSFLGLYGDTDDYWTRPVIIRQFETMKMTADALQIDFELVVMKGIGHQFPPDYNETIREWMKRQRHSR